MSGPAPKVDLAALRRGGQVRSAAARGRKVTLSELAPRGRGKASPKKADLKALGASRRPAD